MSTDCVGDILKGNTKRNKVKKHSPLLIIANRHSSCKFMHFRQTMFGNTDNESSAGLLMNALVVLESTLFNNVPLPSLSPVLTVSSLSDSSDKNNARDFPYSVGTKNC